MKFSSDFFGTPIKEYRCKADPRWTMNYSAAIGEKNLLYYNDDLPGGDITVSLAGKTSIQDGVNLFFNVFNFEGKRVISSGSLSLKV
jgi:hypothetical protein